MNTMKMKSSYAAGSIAVAVVLALAGCNRGPVIADASKADKVVLTYPQGGTVVTNAQVIADLAAAMKGARVDNTLYDTSMTLRMEFSRNSINLLTIRLSAGGSLFRLGKTQYRDRTGRFQEIIRGLTERSKEPTAGFRVRP